ncbi:uncharacterized protein PG986_001039 [Apiospora aurea]|uniref:Uncharacterized protein n=1 Tax=Apiospora aurea TaxID=335848 RepID=A0ABR1QVP6_9PEZI
MKLWSIRATSSGVRRGLPNSLVISIPLMKVHISARGRGVAWRMVPPTDEEGRGCGGMEPGGAAAGRCIRSRPIAGEAEGEGCIGRRGMILCWFAAAGRTVMSNLSKGTCMFGYGTCRELAGRRSVFTNFDALGMVVVPSCWFPGNPTTGAVTKSGNVVTTAAVGLSTKRSFSTMMAER